MKRKLDNYNFSRRERNVAIIKAHKMNLMSFTVEKYEITKESNFSFGNFIFESLQLKKFLIHL